MNEFRPPTKFEQKVYDALHLIPKGKVTTYRALGENLHPSNPGLRQQSNLKGEKAIS